MLISSRRCVKSSIHSPHRGFRRNPELSSDKKEDYMKLEETIKAIKPLDETAMRAARARQDTLTKPRGSLGRLEEVSIQLAGMKADPFPCGT
jgi:nicotinate-nucleotide--dimethylbenzimidazole phosphoribosyltransferase